MSPQPCAFTKFKILFQIQQYTGHSTGQNIKVWQKTFKFAAATLWNSFPDHFRTENSFSQFKRINIQLLFLLFLFAYSFQIYIALFQCLSIFYPNMLNFLLYYVMLHVDAGGNPARHCQLIPGRHLYALCTVQ